MTRSPKNEYLWQGAGEADELIARLERLLAPLRYDPVKPPAAGSDAPPDAMPPRA